MRTIDLVADAAAWEAGWHRVTDADGRVTMEHTGDGVTTCHEVALDDLADGDYLVAFGGSTSLLSNVKRYGATGGVAWVAFDAVVTLGERPGRAWSGTVTATTGASYWRPIDHDEYRAGLWDRARALMSGD